MKTVVLLALFAGVFGQDKGPTVPVNNLDANVCSNSVTFVADENNRCWFYQCAPGNRTTYRLAPLRCGLGSFVLENYVANVYNPCTERFDIAGMYDCTKRKGPLPTCPPLDCKNGGNALCQGSISWCNCSLEWQGAPDCSQRRQNTTAIPFTAWTCPGTDWCAQAIAGNNGLNPCANGGTCINQCFNFVCACPVPYTKDRYCSAFDCSKQPNECPVGQSCRRGVNGRDEFYTCA